MFSKEEKSNFNHLFWGEFKSHMKQTTSSLNTHLNWLNYPTHLKHTYLRLGFDKDEASMCFDIQFKDEEIRSIFWDQLLELRKLIDTSMSTPTLWIKTHETEERTTISRLKWQDSNLSLYNKKDWKKAQLFFKERLIEFDIFYQEYKDILIHLIK